MGRTKQTVLIGWTVVTSDGEKGVLLGQGTWRGFWVANKRVCLILSYIYV